jgi:hypothetical protein
MFGLSVMGVWDVVCVAVGWWVQAGSEVTDTGTVWGGCIGRECGGGYRQYVGWGIVAGCSVLIKLYVDKVQHLPAVILIKFGVENVLC